EQFRQGKTAPFHGASPGEVSSFSSSASGMVLISPFVNSTHGSLSKTGGSNAKGRLSNSILSPGTYSYLTPFPSGRSQSSGTIALSALLVGNCPARGIE